MTFCSYRTYGTKCSGCKTTIPANEFVMRALGNVYHIQCFVCTMCGHQLEKGQEFALKDNNLYCKEDYGKIPIKGPANSPPRKQQQESELNFNDDDLSFSLLLFFQGLRVTEQLQYFKRQIAIFPLPHVRESKTVLDSGFHTWILDSNHQQDSRFLEVYSRDTRFHKQNFPDSRFHKQKFPEFQNPLHRAISLSQHQESYAKLVSNK